MPYSSRIIILVTLFFLFPLPSVFAGTVFDSAKYAWSSNSGYINFGRVTVEDHFLGGYAWSANDGWISFQPVQGGVSNDGKGILSGNAWGEGLGWIDFSNVRINTEGKFSGTATGTLVGTITFDCPHFCDVRTDWQPHNAGGLATKTTTESLPLPTPTQPTNEAIVVPQTVSSQDQMISEHAKSIDIIHDGKIDITDFNALMVGWGTEDQTIDMNRDGVVDVLDFNQLMVFWGVTY